MLGIEVQPKRLKVIVLVTYCYVIDCPPKHAFLKEHPYVLWAGNVAQLTWVLCVLVSHWAAMKAPARLPWPFQGWRAACGGEGVSLGTASGSGRGWTGMNEASGPAKTTKAGRRETLPRTLLPQSPISRDLGSLAGRVPRWETPGFPGWQMHLIVSTWSGLHHRPSEFHRPHWVPAPVRVSWSPPGVGNWVPLSAVEEQGLCTQPSNVTQ